MRVAILPSGALLADTAPGDDEASDGLSVAARVRVARAFGRGPGHALLDLGATELDAALAPALAFLRDLGRAFVTRLCAVPDLEDRAYGIGQHKNVLVHKLVCRGTVEERIDRLIEDKHTMMRGVIQGDGEPL